ncbi:MAG TPA: hypothetical protein VMU95_25000 [Trebonia sp.]|nr:hypothetical protein [Trebonia sp.]
MTGLTRRSALLAGAGATAGLGIALGGSRTDAVAADSLASSAGGPVPATVIGPSGDTTGVTDYDNITAAIATVPGGLSVVLLPGQWYLSQTLALATDGQVLSGSGPGTVVGIGTGPQNAGGTGFAGFSGSSLFSPAADNLRLTSMAVATGPNGTTGAPISFIDFDYTYVDYLELGHLTVSGAVGSGALVTRCNLHRSSIRNCSFTQNEGSSEIWSLGWSPANTQNTKAGLSVTTFENITSVAACSENGVRTTPAWNIYAVGNKDLDVIRWVDCFFLNAGVEVSGGQYVYDSTQYMVDVACTGGASNVDGDRVSFTRCDFGQAIGGAIRVGSFTSVILDHVTCGNMIVPVNGVNTGAQQDILHVGSYPWPTLQTGGTKSGAQPIATVGQNSASVSIRDYCREGDGIGSSVSDISVSSDTVNVRIENCAVPDVGTPPRVDLNGAAGAVIENPEPKTSILNPASDTIVIGNGAITIGGVALTAS